MGVESLAFDTVRGQLVVLARGPYEFNGIETWEWNGSQWHLRSAAATPSWRQRSPLAYDISRRRIVLFGGGHATFLSPPNNWQFALDAETWEYDGSQWLRRTPLHSPPARWWHALSYDWRRHRTVLFGGTAATGADLGDTWEWDGSDWTQRLTAPAPLARSAAAMAYDPAVARTLLFGGVAGSFTGATIRCGDTWEWDGARWLSRPTSQSPSPRYGASMFRDPASSRVVLRGGYGSSLFTDRWEWDGRTWNQGYAAALSGPDGKTVYDSVAGEELLLSNSIEDEVRVWRGGSSGKLREVVPPPSLPGRCGHAMAYDWSRGRTVLFGGRDQFGYWPFDDTWEWDGANWAAATPAVRPVARWGHAMAYDIARRRVVLFGGRDFMHYYSDTWEWDGVAWVGSSAPGPQPRTGHAMAYDAWRGVTVVFSGEGLTLLPDLWEWNGTSWRQRVVPPGPSPRTAAAMSFDIGRGRMVLFGGEIPSATPGPNPQVLADTWELDAVGWSPCLPRHSPFAVSNAAMVYDFAHGRSLLLTPTAWSWDGGDWTAVDPVPWPRWRSELAAAYDVRRDRAVVCGGRDQSGLVLADTWELGPLGIDLAPGCPGSTALVPRLSIATPPRLAGGYRATLDGLLPAATFAVVIAGASDTTSPVGPLPIDLTSLGMPGCMLAVSPDQFTVVAVQAGHGDYIVPVPDAPALVGLTTSDQAACPDPAANALGVTLSNAVRATVEW